MRLGIGSYTYGWSVGTYAERPPGALSALDLIDRARALGVGLVQICDNLPASTWDPDSVAAIAAKAGASAIRVGPDGPAIGIGPDPQAHADLAPSAPHLNRPTTRRRAPRHPR